MSGFDSQIESGSSGSYGIDGWVAKKLSSVVTKREGVSYLKLDRKSIDQVTACGNSYGGKQ